jgi:cyclopropane fatty-acyl-phospholipid synthase-like methyltransferase
VVSTRIPQRIRWAVDVLDVRPSDNILEIGPGPGVALSLICDRLTDGRITGIDRSVTAVSRASKRNAGCIAAGRATVIHTDLADVSFDGPRFDKVFAINVNLFWVQPDGPHLPIVTDLLRPDGRLLLFYEAPTVTKADQIVQTVEGALVRHGFTTSSRSASVPVMTCVEAWLDARRRRRRDRPAPAVES